MSFLIETTIGGFKYWVRFLELESHVYEWVGIKNTATEFKSEEIAEAWMEVVKIKTPLIVVNNKQ